MAKMIQIRNVSERLHRLLKARAAMSGLSLSDYLLQEMERVAQYPTAEEFRRRLATRDVVSAIDSTVQWVREERDSR